MQTIPNPLRLRPEAAAFVVQGALEATGVPGARNFGTQIQAAINWIYQNGGMLALGRGSTLDQWVRQAVMQMQNQPQQQQQQQLQPIVAVPAPQAATVVPGPAASVPGAADHPESMTAVPVQAQLF